MRPTILLECARALLEACQTRGLKIATAESCTGGMVMAALTAIPGSASVVDRGFVTYSNEAKTEMLGVPPGLIAACGAVSEAVARRMAAGAVRHSRADLAVSITGIAGPDGGTLEKPVGTVYFGVHRGKTASMTERKQFRGDRAQIRDQAVLHALTLALHAATVVPA